MTPTRRVVPAAEWAEQAARLRATHPWFCFLDAVDGIGRGDDIVVTLRVRDPETWADAELVAAVPRDAGHLPSLRELWPAAGWSERGVAEAFGVTFDGGDPRSLLLDPAETPAFPLRKDRLLPARQQPWPGAKEDPAEGRTRRRLVPTGVPDPTAATPDEIVATAYGSGRGRR